MAGRGLGGLRLPPRRNKVPVERQCVGIDLHRGRSVIVRKNADGDVLSKVHIMNDPLALAEEVAASGPEPEVVLEATFGSYWAADVPAEPGCRVHLTRWGTTRGNHCAAPGKAVFFPKQSIVLEILHCYAQAAVTTRWTVDNVMPTDVDRLPLVPSRRVHGERGVEHMSDACYLRMCAALQTSRARRRRDGAYSHSANCHLARCTKETR
jgi:hypothetical protein